MSAAFTPGPWVAAAGPSSIVGWPIVSCGGGPGAGRSIASVSWMPGLPDELVDEIRANANLIAAAPELLRGCNALLGLLQLLLGRDDLTDEVRDAMLTSHRVQEAQAAVAKARGETL